MVTANGYCKWLLQIIAPTRSPITWFAHMTCLQKIDKRQAVLTIYKGTRHTCKLKAHIVIQLHSQIGRRSCRGERARVKTGMLIKTELMVQFLCGSSGSVPFLLDD
jgi:hypothetical protein